jgi:hypothetical protein
MATKNAHWQAAFRRRMREAGLKAVTVWLPKEGAVRLARYPEKERGEVVTRALVLLESQGKLTGKSRDGDEGEAEEDTLTLAGLFTRLERLEATLSTITSNSTGVITGDEPPGPLATITGESTDKSTGEVVTVTEIPHPPVTELIDTQPVTTLPEPPTKLPPKRVAALIRKAKNLSAQGVSWKAIAQRFNDEVSRPFQARVGGMGRPSSIC